MGCDGSRSSRPIVAVFEGMNIHLPAISGFTRVWQIFVENEHQVSGPGSVHRDAVGGDVWMGTLVKHGQTNFLLKA